MARYRITIDGTEYPCERWETVERPRTLKESWRDGWVGGMGEYLRRHRDTFYISSNCDTSTYPFVRLRPTLNNSIAINPTATDPMFAWTAEDSGGEAYLYIFGTKLVAELIKIKISDHSSIEVTTFGANSKAGRFAFFNGDIYLALGDSVDAQKITTVAVGSGDTFATLTDDKALAFAAMNDEATAKLWRAHTTNKVDVSSTGAAGSFSADFEVGDTTTAINDMITFQGELLISKPDAPWRFGGVVGASLQGQAFPVIDYAGRSPSITGSFGSTMASMNGFAYWPHGSGIIRIFGQGAKPVDPGARPDWVGAALDSAVPSYISQWDSVAIMGLWIYATNQTDLFYGRIQEDGTIAWHGILVNSGNFLRCFIVDGGADGPALWVVNSSSSGNGGTAERIGLEKDGSVRKILATGAGRGDASLTAQIWMPQIDFGEPNVEKQLSYMAAEVENVASNAVTVSLRVHRDRAFTSEEVGSSTSDGLIEASWTAGTNDTFREVMASVRMTTTGSYSNKDPRIRSLTIGAVTPYVYKAVLPITQKEMDGVSSSVRSALTTLRQLKSGASIAIREPAFNATFTGYVEEVRERATGAETGPGVGYNMEITIRRWVV